MLSELFESDIDIYDQMKNKIKAKWDGKEVAEETAGDSGDGDAAGGDDDAGDDDE